MRAFFENRLLLIITFIIFMNIYGCVSMMENMPAPPSMLVKVELNGPYDKEIPEKYVNQLKGASLVSDWAIPYIFISVGMHFESLGDETRTLHFFDRAIAEFRKRQNTTGEGTALNRKIFALYEFGKIQDAFNTVKEVEKNWTAYPLQAFVYHNYGHYYLMNGDYDQSLNYFRKSLKSNENFRDDFNLLMLRRDSELECGIAVILADYYPAMSKKFSLLDFDESLYKAIRKNVDEGISHLQQTITLNEEIKKNKIGKLTPGSVFQVMESNIYNFLGLACGIKGRMDEANRYLNMSNELAVKANYRIGEVDSIFFRNQIYLLEKNITEGKKVAQRLDELADKYRLPFYQVWAKFILSRYSLGFGDSLQAVKLLKEAVSVMEKQRSGLIIDVLKETYMFNRQVLYDALIEILAKEGDYRGAMETAERAKSRVLVDLLAGKDMGKTAAETELLREEKRYSDEIAAGYRKIMAGSGGGSAFDSTLEKIAEAEAGHRSVVVKIKEKSEELYSLISVEPPDAYEIQQLLDTDTTLFSYYVTDKMLYIWAVNKDSVHLERVKMTREDIARLVSSFNKAIIAKDKQQTKVLSEIMYDTFLKPAIPFVKGDRIGFIPHGALCYLPFAAMSYKGKYLIDGFSIFHLPGAGLLKYVVKKQQLRISKVLAFGNPDLGDKQLDLPYAEAEVESIKKIMPQTDIYTRAEATKDKASKMMADCDIIHFATHGLYVEDAPMNSGLLLSPGDQKDGRLTAMEIFKLRFTGRAVVMSACKTALGLSSTGTEITGLNRAFLYAGSPSVIATFWNIEDKATAVFMEIFYKNLKKNDDIADSLKKTQSEMIRLGYEPYAWAAFTLTGRY